MVFKKYFLDAVCDAPATNRKSSIIKKQGWICSYSIYEVLLGIMKAFSTHLNIFF